MLPWARRHVLGVARRESVGPRDLWDEAVTALLRVSVYRADTAAAIRRRDHYSQRAITRACWRYVVRHARTLPTTVRDGELAAPSAEDEVMAREAISARAHSAAPRLETPSRLPDLSAPYSAAVTDPPVPPAAVSAPSNLPTADRPVPPAAVRVRRSSAAASR